MLTISIIRKLRQAAANMEAAEVAVAKATVALDRLPDDASSRRMCRAEWRLESAVDERTRCLHRLTSAYDRALLKARSNG